jgi:hypothetical protein
MNENKELIPQQTVVSLVDNYKKIVEEIERGFGILDNAKKLAVASFSSHGIMPDRFDDYDFNHNTKQSQRYITRNVWNYVVRKCQIDNIASSKRWNDMQKMIEEGKMPEITVENILGIIMGFSSNIDQLIEESIVEVFDWLRPTNSEYKTNDKYEIGNKVILNWFCEENYSGGFRVSWTRLQKLKTLDNCFNLLDGKGPVKYPGDLVTQFENASQSNSTVVVTDYFECKMFKKGTLHIRIKREDLLQKLNAIAGKNYLKRNEEKSL